MTLRFDLGATRAGAEREPLVVEFFGPPGSGKSTLAREVAARLSRADAAMLNTSEYLADGRDKFGRAMRKSRLILSSGLGREDIGLVKQAAAIPQARMKDRVRAVSTLATVLALYARLERQHRDAVVDQGLLQAAFSVMYGSDERGGDDFVDALTQRAAKSRHIHVSLQVPRETCIERLKGRLSQHSRLQSDLSANWVWAERLLESIWDRLLLKCQEKGNEAVAIAVDGTVPLAQSAEALCLKLGQIHAEAAQ